MQIQSKFLRRPAVACAVVAAIAASATGLAQADAVTEWSERASSAVATAGPPPTQNRLLAIIQIAVHDALNDVTARYESYTPRNAAPEGSSASAAAISAAYTAISQLIPAQAASLLVVYENRLVELPPCPAPFPTCIEDGVATGIAAAQRIMSLRNNDGSATPHLPYTVPPGPGIYEPTPPAYAAPQNAGWANVTPFALTSPSQFRAPPSAVLNLHSFQYTMDFNEVKALGNTVVRSANPDSEKSQIARFWPAGGANPMGVARTVATGRGLDLWQHARLFALVTMAVMDSTVSVFETKYYYNFWRPVTAIRAADTDGNWATAKDPTWLSYQVTPPYPDYVCGLPTNVGAGTEVLRRFFEQDWLPFTYTAGGITRSFWRLSQAEDDAVNARVFGGMHFRTGCVQGIKYGGKVGNFVYQTQLRPIQ